MGPENNVGLGGWIIKCLLPYLCMVTVSHVMVGLERMLDYIGVGLARFYCIFKGLYKLTISASIIFAVPVLMSIQSTGFHCNQ